MSNRASRILEELAERLKSESIVERASNETSVAPGIEPATDSNPSLNDADVEEFAKRLRDELVTEPEPLLMAQMKKRSDAVLESVRAKRKVLEKAGKI